MPDEKGAAEAAPVRLVLSAIACALAEAW